MTEQAGNPVAIITGGARGIGAACGIALAARGMNILISYSSREEEARSTVETCQKLGVDADAMQSDVTSDDQCLDLASRALDRWQSIDVLVNNAGATKFADQEDLDSLEREDFDHVFAVNVTGAWQMTRAAATALRESPNGSVVNISSHSGISGIGSSTAYAASKGALNTLTLSLARSLAPDIRVNAVCPGFVDTNWMEAKLHGSELADFKEKTARIAPLQRLVKPEEVAEAVSWFALGGHSISGQLLVIDGGTHLTTGNPL